MTVIRYLNSDNADLNANAIIDIIKDKNTKKIVFFATYTNRGHQPDSVLPLMAAIAEYEIPSIELIHIVFDGKFLTAVCKPRYSEVKSVLDQAESSGKAYFSNERVLFTSEFEAENAASTLSSMSKIEELNQSTRKKYFSLLCNVSEADYP